MSRRFIVARDRRSLSCCNNAQNTIFLCLSKVAVLSERFCASCVPLATSIFCFSKQVLAKRYKCGLTIASPRPDVCQTDNVPHMFSRCCTRNNVFFSSCQKWLSDLSSKDISLLRMPTHLLFGKAQNEPISAMGPPCE